MSGVEFRWAASSDRGKRRRINEDRYFAAPGVFVVADGMGGHRSGDVASQMAVDYFSRLLPEFPLPAVRVESLIGKLNSKMREWAAMNDRLGMGTTIVAALLVDYEGSQGLVVINVGDSRCYVSDDAGFRQVTHDHSLVQDLVDAGSITPDQADHHPDRNVVTRAVGVDSTIVADYVFLPPLTDQRLVLCSDGVCGQLSESTIAQIVTSGSGPAETVHFLIREVLAGNAPDNATAVVIDVAWACSGDDGVGITGPRPDSVDGLADDQGSPSIDITAPREMITGQLRRKLDQPTRRPPNGSVGGR